MTQPPHAESPQRSVPSIAEQRKKLARYFTDFPERFESLLPPQKGIHSKFALEVATCKRILEIWSGDRDFRTRLDSDPKSALDSYGICLESAGISSLEEIRPLWDLDLAIRYQKEEREVSDAVLRYRLWMAEKLLEREETIREDCAPTNNAHRIWRARQMNRARSQLGSQRHEGIVHAPFVVELSDGCSVGCWFCGVSALKHEGDFPYNTENQKLWREVLQCLEDHLGSAAETGFCYWATDPLDNADYEDFLVDFKEICGHWPQTTTSQPQKEVERTRRLLKLAFENGAGIQRFSILNRKILKTVMQNFDPVELLHTEMVLQNKEADTLQSNSGRARGSKVLEKRASDRESSLASGWDDEPGTISCVSGFLINMCTKSIRLVSPAPSDERWPKGHWIFEESFFTDGASFKTTIEGMVERHMKTYLRAGDPLRFRRDLKIDLLKDGFVAHSYGERVTYQGESYMALVGERIANGQHTAGEVAIEIEDLGLQPASMTFEFLNRLFQQGLIDEEPEEDPTRDFDEIRNRPKRSKRTPRSEAGARALNPA